MKKYLKFIVFFVLSLTLIKVLVNKRSKSSEIIGYPNQVTYIQGSEISISYSSKKEKVNSHLTAVRIFDALSDKLLNTKIIDPKDHPLVTSVCKSFKNLGCEYPHQLKLDTKDIGTGFFYAILYSTDYLMSQRIFFVINPPRSEITDKHIAVMIPTFTWQAYNMQGGANFYNNEKEAPKYMVNTQRPIEYDGYHGPQATLAFAKLLAAKDHKIYGISSEDLHHMPDALAKTKFIVLTGHDEYWTGEMRDRFESFIRGGGRAAIFSGNVLWWKVNYSNHLISIYKGQEKLDGSTSPEFINTGLWNSDFIKRGSESLIGLSFDFGGYPIQRKIKKEKMEIYKISPEEYEHSKGIQVIDANHPIFAKTGLKNGDWFGVDSEVIRIELDGLPMTDDGKIDFKLFPKAIPDIQLLGRTISYRNGIQRPCVIVDIPLDKGRIVHLGSIGWYAALGDPIVKKVAENTIDYLVDLE